MGGVSFVVPDNDSNFPHGAALQLNLAVKVKKTDSFCDQFLETKDKKHIRFSAASGGDKHSSISHVLGETKLAS